MALPEFWLMETMDRAARRGWFVTLFLKGGSDKAGYAMGTALPTVHVAEHGEDGRHLLRVLGRDFIVHVDPAEVAALSWRIQDDPSAQAERDEVEKRIEASDLTDDEFGDVPWEVRA